MSLSRRTAIVGVGSTPYYKRGRSAPQTLHELVGKAILSAVEDAGLKVSDIDGFASYSGGFDTPYLMETLGVPEVRFTSMLTGSGGGSAGAVGLASAAVVAGLANVVVVIGGVQQGEQRFGSVTQSYDSIAENSYWEAAGLIGPGHMFALLARRHMYRYGTTRDHFAEVAISTRLNAINHPDAIIRKPLTREDYFAAPMIADPMCLFDFCLESDGAIAVIVTSTERARDLKRKPVVIHGCAQGGEAGWGRSLYWMNMPEDQFLTSGNRSVAKDLWRQSGLTPADIDVAQIYDHFTPMVIVQFEDYGFCAQGEGGPFVASGAIRFEGGSLPVNTDGGQLSGGYIWGMSHIREGVAQIRGDAVNQVPDAKFTLVTGGPSSVPMSGLILGE